MITNKIKGIAIHHFNELGYEGTKMARIAVEAGITKQSLSYHYPSKKELFKELYAEVIEEELPFITNFFKENKEYPVREQLYRFLNEMKVRFHVKPNVMFLQRLSFVSSLEVSDWVLSMYRNYIHTLKTETLNILKKLKIRSTAEEATSGFLTLFDGLMIQLVYENKHSFERAFSASFDIYWHGIYAEPNSPSIV
ncbi:TetR/AcrR family transcriptional regulator [Priestia filamentosa]|uniref:TetR/AcrR family transcriptional regulator n=2 Tax=Priestia filamentosa TaxID=1402861 RepID=UPI000E72D152|nr:TetR/AcrR family transcriptional regulator [Priestia filamentosa]RJS63633.1 TetR family transcriptional regulator [Priestia filamentosa]